AKRKHSELTTPDLVLLSLLAEAPMHGYQANLELERRQVRDWAAISRPQVYYSLEKLERLGLLRPARDEEAAAGPERRVLQTTAKGKAALKDALASPQWTQQRERPPFLTWLALSWQADPETFCKQVAGRRAFLNSELAREEATLSGVKEEVGHEYHEAVWMISLVIDQMKAELRWLERLEREARLRAPAKHPQLVSGDTST
ncbi:MAG: PadR family transcriptional regulator, partial [Acidobacteria bacterium]|nr:PadR family transcriptional regulator [Acidobacteriota bacterium]